MVAWLHVLGHRVMVTGCVMEGHGGRVIVAGGCGGYSGRGVWWRVTVAGGSGGGASSLLGRQGAEREACRKFRTRVQASGL